MALRMRHVRCPTTCARGAFSLVELLVVIGIISVLITVLLAAISAARDAARTTVCLSNLRQIGIAIHNYATSNRGRIPFGPKAPPFDSAIDFYPSTGTPTSLVSLKTGVPVGLGLLLDSYLAKQQHVLFCPAADQEEYADEQLALVGHDQAQCSYYYRHGSVTRMFEDPSAPLASSDHILLSNLGRNRNGIPLRALVMDTMFETPPGFVQFGIYPRTHHHRRFANILYSDGHAISSLNTNGKFTVNMNDPSLLRTAFDRMVQIFEAADADAQ